MLIIYLVLINAVSFILMLVDKYKAVKKLWRIPEAILFVSAIAGGSIGALCGMRLARHKTKHLSFALGIPIILALQVLLGLWFLTK